MRKYRGIVVTAGARLAVFMLLGACTVGATAAAETHIGYPHNYLQILGSLEPGDHLRLAPGDYRMGLPIHFINGKSGKPIVIESLDKRKPARFLGPPRRNTVGIINSSHVVVRHLILQAVGHAGDGVKAEGFAVCDWTHHITLEGLQILGFGGSQQRVGISTKCPAWEWVIRGNRISGAGTGIYLGNSDGSAPFINGVIEDNVIFDSMGYNLQIKHQLPRGYETPGIPEHDGVTIVRRNIFSKANGSGPAKTARPNVLVGHAPLAGAGLGDWYHIYGNVFYQNPHEALLQGEGNLAIYNNVFINSTQSNIPAVAVQRHHWFPRNVNIFHNTVVARNGGIRIRSAMAAHDQKVYGNIVFSEVPVADRYLSDNHTGPYEAASSYLAKPFARLGRLDVYPRTGVKFKRYSDELPLEHFTESEKDFNGTPRFARFPGAYAGAGQNPGTIPGVNDVSNSLSIHQPKPLQ